MDEYLFCSSNGQVYAIDKRSHSLVWRRSLPGTFHSSSFANLLIDGGVLYVAYKKRVIAYDAATGEQLASLKLPKSASNITMLAGNSGSDASGGQASIASDQPSPQQLAIMAAAPVPGIVQQLG